MANFDGMTGEIKTNQKSKQLEWKITNYSSLLKERGSFFNSPSFTFAKDSWHLSIRKRMCLKVILNCETRDSCPDVICSISIKQSDGSLTAAKELITNASRKFSYTFLNPSILQQNKIILLPSDILTVVFNLTIYDSNLNGEGAITPALLWESCSSTPPLFHRITSTQKATCLNENSAVWTLENTILAETDELSKNFKDLFLNGECCDAVLQVKDKEFKVHRAVLVARSSVFAAMFKHDTSEKQTGIINVPDCDADTFQQFLEYLYSGKLEDISLDSAVHLYITSDKYVVKELKVFCTKYMMKNLTVQKICDVVILADQYDETELLSATQKFFNENFKQIVKTSEWENLMKLNYRLANKLIINVSEYIG